MSSDPEAPGAALDAPSRFNDVTADLLGRGIQVRFRAGGRSMAPTILDGEMIQVRPVPTSGIGRGDILFYRCARGLIAHRVIRIDRRTGASGTFIVRGDSSTTPDAPVEEAQILGQVMAVERDGRRIDLASRKARAGRAFRALARRLRSAASFPSGRQHLGAGGTLRAGTGRSEHQVLLSCASVSWDSGRAAGFGALLAGPIDWDVLLPLASRHGLLPLLHWRIGAAGADRIPMPIRDRLRDSFDTNHRRNLFLGGELCRILERFGEQGVQVVPFKGIVLAAAVYEHLALRQFTDLDILVRKEDVPQAWGLLESLGFKPNFNTAIDRKRIMDLECELLFMSRDQRVFVELHWATAPPKFAVRQDIEGLWSRMVPGGTEGLDATSFSPEDTVLSLCIHGARHLWDRLIWISDLARWVIAHGDLDWDWILREARARGIGRILLIGLSLSRDIGGAVLPETVLEHLERDRKAGDLAARLRERFFKEQDERSLAMETILLHLGMRECRRDRLEYIFQVARKGTARDQAFAAPISFLGPLAHVPRLLRLAVRYSPVLVRRLCHGSRAG